MPKKKVEKIIVDGNDTSEYTFPKLQEFCVYLLQKLDYVRKDRNFLQVQCSQMRTAWEMARMKLEEAKCIIRTTRLKKDFLDVDSGYNETMKNLVNESKFLTREKELNLDRIIETTNNELQLMDRKWTDDVLMLMLEDKLDLKIKNDEELALMSKRRLEFDEKIEAELDIVGNIMDAENAEVYQKEKAQLEKGQKRLTLMAENSLIKVQEEYNKLFYLMKTFGDSHFSTLKNFYKKVMDDDIAMILVMKREVNNLARTVKEKKEYCAELNDQIEQLRLSKGKLVASLRRLQNKVKNRRVKLSNCEKSEAQSVRLANETKAMFEEYVQKMERLKSLQKQEEVLQRFLTKGFIKAQRRKKEILNVLTEKLRLLASLAAKDEILVKNAAEHVEPEIRGITNKKLKELRTTSATSLGHLLLGVARECRNHDDIVDMANAHLPNNAVCAQLEKINFQPVLLSIYKNEDIV